LRHVGGPRRSSRTNRTPHRHRTAVRYPFSQNYGQTSRTVSHPLGTVRPGRLG